MIQSNYSSKSCHPTSRSSHFRVRMDGEGWRRWRERYLTWTRSLLPVCPPVIKSHYISHYQAPRPGRIIKQMVCYNSIAHLSVKVKKKQVPMNIWSELSIKKKFLSIIFRKKCGDSERYQQSDTYHLVLVA